MQSNRFVGVRIVSVALTLFALVLTSLSAFAQAPPAITQLGTVKLVTPTALTIAPDSGTDATVQLDATTKIVAIAPGEKDLSKAVPLQPSDLQPGDRVRVRARMQADAKSLIAVSVIAIKQTDLASRRQKELQAWQHGVGGLVKSVDASTRTVTISSLSAATKDIKVELAPSTVLRRYAPGSIRFDEAKPSTLDEIHPGDQLRARGTRSADGAQFTAEEVVTGAFRNLSGLLSAVDPIAGTLTLQDLVSKKTITVAVNKDSQLKKIPEMLAQRLAMRLKGGTPELQSGAPQQSPAMGSSPAGSTHSGNGNGGDLQQMLARLPSAGISELQKGDAVLIVATEESAATKPTVITLLSGVEPILTASPNGGGASLLSPWTLSSAPEGANQ